MPAPGSLLKSLLHYRRSHLAVAAGAAVCTAVLTGALLVGDSVRASLRSMTLERLGAISHALVSADFFRAALADELAADRASGARPATVAPVILSAATALRPASGARASGVQLVGCDQRFLQLFEGGEDDGAQALAATLTATASGPPPVVLNAALAAELGAAPGDEVLLNLPRWSQVPR